MPIDRIWLMASYFMPGTYSIRVPVSSPLCGTALPTPGPATVQLAMIRSGIELYGLDVTRDALFPSIVASNPQIQPPDRVAISGQLLRMHKADAAGRLVAGIGYREFCCCDGLIRVFLQVPQDLAEAFSAILSMIGYWGRSDSFACCTEVARTQPESGRYARRIHELPEKVRLRSYFSAYATELVRPDLNWTEVVMAEGMAHKSHVRLQLYVWPLIECEHRGTGQVLRFCSLGDAIN